MEKNSTPAEDELKKNEMIVSLYLFRHHMPLFLYIFLKYVERKVNAK